MSEIKEDEMILLKTDMIMDNLLVDKDENIFDTNESVPDFMEVDFELVKTNECEEVIESIGYIHGLVIDRMYMMDYHLSAPNELDAESGDLAALIPLLYKFDEDGYDYKFDEETWNMNVFYIENLYIEPKYRNQGWGRYLLENLEDLLLYQAKQSIGLIITLPLPFEEKDGMVVYERDDKDKQKELIKFCRKCGYKKIAKENYVYKVAKF